MSELFRSDVMLAFALMGIVTVAIRAGGYWLMGYVEFTPRVRRMMAALPGSIIVAAALPAILNGGPVVIGAIIAAILMAIATRNDFLAVATGMGVAAVARALGFQ